MQGLIKDSASSNKALPKEFGVIGSNEPSAVPRNSGHHTSARHSPRPALDNYEEGLSHV